MFRFIIFLTIFFCISITLFSQNEDGVRNVDFLEDDPPFSVFHTAVPIIRSIPPLSLSMPIEVLMTYIVMDSLGRFYNDSAFRAVRGQNLSEALRSLEPSNDTLHNIWKFVYKATDYNPILFRQYLSEQVLNQNANVYFKVYYNIGLLLERPHYLSHPLKKRIASAIIPDYVLKVQVVKIDSMKAPFTSYGGDTSNYNFFKISCIVLDTIKGKVIPMDTINISENRKNKEEFQSISYRFNFVVSKNSYFQLRRGCSSRPHPFPLIDSLIFDNYRQIMRVHPGQELLVFLNEYDPLWSKTHDHFQFHTSQNSSNSGVMPIINGMVSDINKVWSDSTWIQYETFKQRYNEIKEVIMNKDY